MRRPARSYALQPRFLRACLWFSLAALVLGCDSKPKSESRPKTIQSPTAPPAQRLSSEPPADQQPVGRQPAATQPTAKTQPKSKAAVGDESPFADEEPGNVFTVVGDKPIESLGTEADVAAVDRVTIGEFSPEFDSSTFIVEAASATERVAAVSRNAEFKLPEGFVEVSSYGYSELGIPLRIRGEKTGALMALVPGGAARIGTNDGPEEAQPEFEPFLDSFYLDINEVTLGQYREFGAETRQKKNHRVQSPVNEGDEDDMPALGLPWGVAQGFLTWAGKELPTEAEFEFAMRGPMGWRTPWGDGRAVWPEARSLDQIGPVQKFPTDQSPFGIFDLAGNAKEWCADLYSPTAHRDASSASQKLQRNWAGPKKGAAAGIKVVKGSGPDWSAWHRQGRAGSEKHPDVGFRGVLRLRSLSSSESSSD